MTKKRRPSPVVFPNDFYATYYRNNLPGTIALTESRARPPTSQPNIAPAIKLKVISAAAPLSHDNALTDTSVSDNLITLTTRPPVFLHSPVAHQRRHNIRNLPEGAGGGCRNPPS